MMVIQAVRQWQIYFGTGRYAPLMVRYGLFLLNVLLLAAIVGCAPATPIAGLYPPPEAAHTRCVYIYRDGRHSGLILPAAQIDLALWPESRDIQGAQFLEISEGEKDFFAKRNTGILHSIKSLLWPSDKVLRVVGLATPFGNFEKSKHDLTALAVSAEGFSAILGFVSESFARDAAGQPFQLGTAFYGPGRGWFYQAAGNYHLFDTCNTWTVNALQQAGFPIRKSQTILSSGVMRQIRNGQQRFNQAGCMPR